MIDAPFPAVPSLTEIRITSSEASTLERFLPFFLRSDIIVGRSRCVDAFIVAGSVALDEETWCTSTMQLQLVYLDFCAAC